ncbi:hypothetical protein COV19_01415 [Candidatus Woesearchaeota archaeon CG10_big_fil_rev_8_21_14_0_10_44_13]|nr:MAG: hypothetical protein COV19_01415 [Candidatus Woesearchaeota archaeon CG10_big_fil_rev_8_21_14_0_10_44_13]
MIEKGKGEKCKEKRTREKKAGKNEIWKKRTNMLRKHEGRVVMAAWVLLAFFLLALQGRHGMTGFVVYEGGSKTHSFAVPELSFNATAMNSSADELKLNLITETGQYDTLETEIINVSSAISNGYDKTEEIKRIDGNYANIDKSRIFDVTFKSNLTDGDMIQFYLLNSDAIMIYLCNLSRRCWAPGYGGVNYDGGTGYYNMTVSNLEDETNGFNIDPPKKVKFDHIRAIKEHNLTHYHNISYYPLQAFAETADFMPDSLYAWQDIAADEQLNGQVIEYYYSTDSGLTWDYIAGKDISSASASSGKIRLRVLFTSDGADTPIVKNITITYSERSTCDPDWQPDDNLCRNDDSRPVTYTDANSCNSSENLPADNGTYAYCDFCTPSWQDINSSCLVEDMINQYFNDANDCYAQTGLSSDNNPPGNNTFSCDFCTPSSTGYNTTCDGQTQAFTSYYIDSNGCYDITGLASDIPPANMTYDCIYDSINTSNATNPENTTQPTNMTNATSQEAGPGLFNVNKLDENTGVMVMVETTVDFTASSISIQNTEIDTSTALFTVNEVNITMDDSPEDNITSITLRFYYNETSLNQSNVNESTLAVYYYDEEYDELQEIPSTINSSGMYVEADINHLSMYGLYGLLNLDTDLDITEGDSTPAQSQQETGGDNEVGAAAESQQDVQPPAEQAISPEASQALQQEAAAELESGLDELSLEPGYNSSEGIGSNQTFYKIGKTLSSGLKNKNNIALSGIILIMLVITYVIVEMRAKRGNNL